MRILGTHETLRMLIIMYHKCFQVWTTSFHKRHTGGVWDHDPNFYGRILHPYENKKLNIYIKP